MASNGGVSASSMDTPKGVFSNGTKLFVADTGNHRVLIWNTIPTANGQAASLVLGQTSMTANSSGVAAYTNVVPAGAFRGYGLSQTIFAVEDDTDISRLVRHHLEAAGYGVRTFAASAGVIAEAE